MQNVEIWQWENQVGEAHDTRVKGHALCALQRCKKMLARCREKDCFPWEVVFLNGADKVVPGILEGGDGRGEGGLIRTLFGM